MAERCSQHLSYLDEPGANPLNASCYMWWDMMPIYGRPDEPDRAEFDDTALAVLQRLLAIPHDACRESALHGLCDWKVHYRPHVIKIVDEFLRHTVNLRPELVIYARRVRDWYVQ
jgi:hypothetical protein